VYYTHIKQKQSLKTSNTSLKFIQEKIRIGSKPKSGSVIRIDTKTCRIGLTNPIAKQEVIDTVARCNADAAAETWGGEGGKGGEWRW
jgi:hypothetical protein